MPHWSIPRACWPSPGQRQTFPRWPIERDQQWPSKTHSIHLPNHKGIFTSAITVSFSLISLKRLFGQRPRGGRSPVEHRGTYDRTFVRPSIRLFVRSSVFPSSGPSGLSGLKSGLSSLKSGLSGLKSGLSVLKSGLLSLNSSLSNLASQASFGLEGLKSGLSGLKSGLSSLNCSLSNLASQASSGLLGLILP